MTMVLDGLEQWGGVPVASQAAFPTPIFGKHWFVDGTNGSDGNSGLSKLEPMATIQAAVTDQIANPTGIGDAIWIFPGTYVESVTGDLTDVSLIGACAHSPGAAKITPSDGSAYRGTLLRAAIRNLSLANSSSTSTTYASLSMVSMTDSLVDNCHIVGVYNASDTTGIRIGTEGTSIDWEIMGTSRISNCMWTHSGTMLNNHEYGLVFGLTGSTSKANKRMFRYSEICYNHIYAEKQGIEVNLTSANGSGGSIHHNVIGSGQFNGNCSGWGITATESGEEDQLIKVYANYINSADCIKNFKAGNVYGNFVSLDGATPDTENPAKS